MIPAYEQTTVPLVAQHAAHSNLHTYTSLEASFHPNYNENTDI